ncbi:MAG: DNA cytosine methyltransferase [Verrucomicrobiota bacterium]
MTAPGTVTEVVLSLFPGIGLLDRGFEDAGFCVVRGPDLWWGGDVRKFAAPAGHFTGIIGGPPCQRFSLANRARNIVPTEQDMELINQYLRIVTAARPDWWLMENVAGSPAVTELEGYVIQRFTLNANQCGSEQHRLRKFHFGHRPGSPQLAIQRMARPGRSQPTCMASEGRRSGRREFSEFCRLQGLPAGFDLPGFTNQAKFTAVGNGVPYEMSLTLATAIRNRDRGVTPHRFCECGCGEFVSGKARLAGVACRKRMQRLRDAAASQNSGPVTVNAELHFQ